MSTITTRRIPGIAGSLRGDSYNRTVLRTLAEQSWEGIEIEIFGIAIPTVQDKFRAAG